MLVMVAWSSVLWIAKTISHCYAVSLLRYWIFELVNRGKFSAIPDLDPAKERPRKLEQTMKDLYKVLGLSFDPPAYADIRADENLGARGRPLRLLSLG